METVAKWIDGWMKNIDMLFRVRQLWLLNDRVGFLTVYRCHEKSRLSWLCTTLTVALSPKPQLNTYILAHKSIVEFPKTAGHPSC